MMRENSKMHRARSKRYVRLTWFFSLVFPIFLLGCSQSPEVVKIGLVAPFEGQEREMGYDGIYAARLAVREFNAHQANNGVKLSLVALDDSSEVDIAIRNAQALAADPAIIAVVGIGNEETRLATAESLAQTSIPFIHSGVLPFESTDPAEYPADFSQAYAEVTPFDEEAGEWAGSVYEAFELIIFSIDRLEQENRPISAESVAEILKSAKIKGLTGKEIFIAGGN